MKRVLIIHGWGGNPGELQLVWLKNELSRRGFNVSIPEMPHPDEPMIDEWVSHLAQEVGTLDADTFFIGQSIGCQTIMRYLQSQTMEAGGCVFIAGWFKLDNLEADEKKIAEPWLNTSIDFEKVKKSARKIVVVLSTNDYYGFVNENKKTFEDKLGATVIILENRGHFAPDDGTTELPEVLEAFLKMSSVRT